MRKMRYGTYAALWSAPMAAVLMVGLAGCRSTPATVSDESLASAVQTQLAGDSAIAGQAVVTNVAKGVVTLSGTVANEAERTIAARDAAGVPGVKEVQNAIIVGTATAAVQPPQSVVDAPPASIPAPLKKSAATLAPEPPRRTVAPPPVHQPAPIVREPQPMQQAAVSAPPPPQPAPPPPPPPPPPPTYKTVTIASGDTLPVRVNQTLDSATTQQGDRFSGTVASDVMVDGVVAIPAGSTVSGQVDVVQEAAHFKGSALLTVSLSSVTRKGEHLSIATDPYTVNGKGRGKNTAEKTGGGAAVGAILGGIFGGGKGAAIGAVTGGGLGAGSNAITRGEQVQIASETVVRFRLANPILIRVRTDGGGRTQTPAADPADPSLQRRSQP